MTVTILAFCTDIHTIFFYLQLKRNLKNNNIFRLIEIIQQMKQVLMKLITIILMLKQVRNFICNGDFEAYSFPAGYIYAILASDYNCWYQKNGGFFEVQRQSNELSKVAELASNQPDILCQNVSLTVGYIYRLNFTGLNQINMNSTTIKVLINNINLFNQTIQGSGNIQIASFNLTAQITNTQICFDYSINTVWNFPSVSPCIDNVTLEELVVVGLNTTNISNITVNQNNVTTNMSSSTTNMTTNQTNNSTAATAINNNTNSTTNQTNTTSNPTTNTNTNTTTTNTTFNPTNPTTNTTTNTTTNQTTPPLNNSSIYQSNSSEQNSSILIKKYANIISNVLILPANVIPGLRVVYVLIDDLWLYYYCDKNYSSFIQTLFQTVSSIQMMKFDCLDKFLGWNKYKNLMLKSDYKPFSKKNFVKIEGTSSVLLDSNFAFFIYTVPQNILLCSGLYFLFILLQKWKVSKYIRKYCFFKTTLIVISLESNLAYFAYVCFLNLQHAFSFNLVDKISLSFTVIFLFVLFILGLTFSMLIFKYLGKQASYFNDSAYRESASFVYRSVTLIRNILRGVIYSFLQINFSALLIMLLILDTSIMLFSIIMQSRYKIFVSKMMYRLSVMYSLLMIAFNITLLMQDSVNNQNLLNVRKAQQIIIYSLTANIALMSIIDSIPQFSCPSHKITDQKIQNRIKNNINGYLSGKDPATNIDSPFSSINQQLFTPQKIQFKTRKRDIAEVEQIAGIHFQQVQFYPTQPVLSLLKRIERNQVDF